MKKTKKCSIGRSELVQFKFFKKDTYGRYCGDTSLNILFSLWGLDGYVGYTAHSARQIIKEKKRLFWPTNLFNKNNRRKKESDCFYACA